MKNYDDGLIGRISHIEFSTLSILAFTFIVAWILTPVLSIIQNLLGINGYTIYKVWATFVYLCGGSGLLLGFIYVIKTGMLKSSSISKKEYFYDFLPIILLTLFLVWCVICSCRASVKFMAFRGAVPSLNSVLVFLLYGGFIMLGLIISQDRRLLSIVSMVFIGIALLLSVISMLNNEFTFKACNVFGMSTTQEYSSIFENSNYFGYYLTIAILVSYFIVMYGESVVKKVVVLIAMGMLVNMLILNNTMGSYLACLLTMIFVVIWKCINNEKGKYIAFVLLLYFVLISFASLIYTQNLFISFAGMFGDATALNNFFEGDLLEDDIYYIGSNRGVLWVNAIKDIKTSPIFGYGLQNAGPYSKGLKIHNVFLQIGVYTGVVGALIYALTYVAGATRMFKERNNLSDITKASAFVIIGYLISDFFGVQVFTISPYFLIVFGACLSGCMSNFFKTPLINSD